MRAAPVSEAPAARASHSLPYRREIDGLRAVAVVPVILFHAGFGLFRGGFAGVDVFFVISGYLISGLILAEAGQGRFSLLQFYERRARRILPALFLVVACCIPAACILMTPAALKLFGRDVAGVALFASNIVFWKQSSYFLPESALNPLLHTWSLAIEEQYYVLFPLFVMLLWPRHRRWFAPLVVAALAASLCLAQWASSAAPAAAYYLLPTRGWELLAGVCVTLACREGRQIEGPRLGGGLALAGLAMIVGAMLVFDETTPYPSFYTLLPVAGTALVIAFARDGTLAARLLSLKPLVWIGLVSYSAYLWHQPLFAFARVMGAADDDLPCFGLLGLASLVLAYFTWRYVENPFRDRSRVARAQIFALAAIGSACVLGAGVLADVTNGGDFRYTPQQKAIFAAYRDAQPKFSRLYRENTCFLSEGGRATRFAANCYDAIIGRSHAFVVWGDSHAASLHMGLFAEFGAAPKAQFTSAGCPPLLHYKMAGEPLCESLNDTAFAMLSRAIAPRVFLIGDWYTYSRRPNFSAAFVRTLQALRKTGADVVVVGSLPQWQPSLPDVVVGRMTQGGLEMVPRMLEARTLGRLRGADRLVAGLTADNGARFVSLLDALCVQSRCRAIIDSGGTPRLLAWDYAHLTREGSLFDAAALMRQLQARRTAP